MALSTRRACPQLAPQDRVEVTLRSVGGGVTVSELAYQTGLSQTEVTEALCELEAKGHATPYTWTLGTEAAHG